MANSKRRRLIGRSLRFGSSSLAGDLSETQIFTKRPVAVRNMPRGRWECSLERFNRDLRNIGTPFSSGFTGLRTTQLLEDVVDKT
jgi:hypothetical protein